MCTKPTPDHPGPEATSINISAASMMLSREEANKLHARDAFVLLRGLPQGAEVGIDGAAWAVDAGFEGFKMVPQGWHMLTWNASSTGSTAPAGTAGLGGGLFRRFERHQFILRTYDPASERFLHPDARPAVVSAAGPGEATPNETRPDPSTTSRVPVDPRLPTDIASLEHLKSLDSQLAPYPLDRSRHWQMATSALHALPIEGQCGTVAAVLGMDPQSGDSWTDPIAEIELVTPPGSQTDAPKLRPRRQESQTPLQRAEAELEAHLARGRDRDRNRDRDHDRSHDRDRGNEHDCIDNQAPTDPKFVDGETEENQRPPPPAHFMQEAVPAIRLPFFDARVSWPQDAYGPLLTRWSLDKSFGLLRLAGDAYRFVHPRTTIPSDEAYPSLSVLQVEQGKAYLRALFELSFILLACTRNSALLSYWSDLLTFFCRSGALLGAPDQFALHPAETATRQGHDMEQQGMDTAEELPVSPDLLFLSGFLHSLRGQLELLDASDLEDGAGQGGNDSTLPGLRHHVVDNLTVFRRNMARALAGSALRASPPSTSAGSTRYTASPGSEQLVASWRNLSHLLQRKYSIDLDTQLDEEIEAGKAPPEQREHSSWTKKLLSMGLDPADVQDLEGEDDGDEDGPAIFSQL